MPQDKADPHGQAARSASRNDSMGFAHRTLKNLEFIEHAREAQEDVHVVTQRVLSLLGLILFPWECGVDRRIETLTLEKLVQEGWPTWSVSQGEARTLGDLVGHLRNAVAHRRLWFSSDARDPRQVSIEFADAKGKTGPIYWRATISANDLRTFCVRFISLVGDVVG